MNKHFVAAAAAWFAAMLATGVVRAATTTTWEMSTYQDFIKGRFSGVALDRDGRLTLAPKLQDLFSSGQAIIWSVAKAPDGSVYAGTGHRGHVYRIAPDGTSTLIWTADQAEVFAVAVDSAGVLYAATSPDGGVFRIENPGREGAKGVEIFNPKAKYIWALAAGSDGTLYAGTGDPANVYAIDKTGKGELYYSTGQGHVTSLAVDAQGRVLAGSEPNGILYRITAKDKAFVLYDANLPEIHSIKAMPDGTVYAAALGGALSTRTGALATYSTGTTAVTVTAPATSVTVTDTQASPPDVKPKPGAATAATAQQTATQQTATTVSPTVEIPGVDKSAIYRINPDNTVETLWSSKDENIYDLLTRPNGEILFGTDVQARIYRLGSDRKPSLIVQANEGEATRLLDAGSAVLAATGDTGKLFKLTPAEAAPAVDSGWYESPVHDSNTVAKWGRISWRQRGGTAAIQTRTGNSLRPDPTWSEWSAPLKDPQKSLVTSPNARYIQWRAELRGPQVVVENVSVAYLPQNNPPVVRSINVTTVASTSSSQGKSTTSSSSAAYTITVTDTGESSSPSSGTPTQTISRGGGSQIQVTWQADDPDSDRLAYSLWFRGEDEQTWKLIRMNMFENSFLIDGDVFADGRYYFRVVASDRPSNPVNVARQAELVSAPVLIDNTPPLVKLSAPVRSNGRIELNVDARDATSALRKCEYSVNAGPWIPVEAADGVTDAPEEQFHIVIDQARPGEQLIVVRVYDAANNAGLAKVVAH